MYAGEWSGVIMRLEANQIHFRYDRGPWLIEQFNMVIESGEIVGLTGPSGCGKTSLCRLLAGYDQPQEGSITLNGAPLPKTGYHPVQLVYQHPEKAVNPRWNMRQTLHEAWKPDDEILSALGIHQQWLSRYPNELSGGELQRVCIARALGPQTRFLIADEMTSMLDAITQAHIWQIVLDVAQERNIGLLVISHDQSLIRRICHRVIEMNQQ